MYEHASSQRRQPVHFSGVIFKIFVVASAMSPLLSSLSFVATGPLQTLDELIERDGGHRHHLHGAARADLDRDTRDRRVVWRVDDREEIVGTQQRVLRDDARAHA